MVTRYNDPRIEDEKTNLINEFYKKNIQRYGGKTTVDYWADCGRYVDLKLQEIKAALSKEEKISQINKPKESFLEERVITPEISTIIEPPKKRKLHLWFKRKDQRPNKGEETK